MPLVVVKVKKEACEENSSLMQLRCVGWMSACMWSLFLSEHPMFELYMTRLVVYNTHPKINKFPYNTQIIVAVMDLTCYLQHKKRPTSRIITLASHNFCTSNPIRELGHENLHDPQRRNKWHGSRFDPTVRIATYLTSISLSSHVIELLQ